MGTDGRRQVFVYTYPRDPWKGKPRPPLVMAYLTWPGGSRDRMCTHLVDVRDGEKAKAAAIKNHRETCMTRSGPDDGAAARDLVARLPALQVAVSNLRMRWDSTSNSQR